VQASPLTRILENESHKLQTSASNNSKTHNTYYQQSIKNRSKITLQSLPDPARAPMGLKALSGPRFCVILCSLWTPFGSPNAHKNRHFFNTDLSSYSLGSWSTLWRQNGFAGASLGPLGHAIRSRIMVFREGAHFCPKSVSEVAGGAPGRHFDLILAPFWRPLGYFFGTKCRLAFRERFGYAFRGQKWRVPSPKLTVYLLPSDSPPLTIPKGNPLGPQYPSGHFPEYIYLYEQEPESSAAYCIVSSSSSSKRQAKQKKQAESKSKQSKRSKRSKHSKRSKAKQAKQKQAKQSQSKPSEQKLLKESKTSKASKASRAGQ